VGTVLRTEHHNHEDVTRFVGYDWLLRNVLEGSLVKIETSRNSLYVDQYSHVRGKSERMNAV